MRKLILVISLFAAVLFAQLSKGPPPIPAAREGLIGPLEEPQTNALEVMPVLITASNGITTFGFSTNISGPWSAVLYSIDGSEPAMPQKGIQVIDPEGRSSVSFQLLVPGNLPEFFLRTDRY